MNSSDFHLYDHLDQPVFVLAGDAQNRPVYRFLNAAALDRLGKTLDQVEGRGAHEVFTGRGAQVVYDRQCAVWKAGKATQYEAALPVGASTVWVKTTMKPVHDANGEMTHMVGLSQDVTDYRNSLKKHVLASAVAHETEDLVCLAAHDLRSPISNLKTLAVLMRKDFVDHGDGKAELIDMIDSISDKALSVVSDIMGQAMSTGNVNDSRRFDLGAVCDDIMVLLDPSRLREADFPRLWITADCMVVHIILRNLIDNAFKHSGAARTRITIEVEQMNEERLKFTVRDNGKGLAALDTASDQTTPSCDLTKSGFGLVGIQRLARSRGGVVTVLPLHAGEGAMIEVELPGHIHDKGCRERLAG